MGRLRRSRRWVAVFAAAAVLGVALNGVAGAESDPPVSTDAPTTTTSAPPPTTSAPAAAPATTAAPAGDDSGGGRVSSAATISGGGGGGGASPDGSGGGAVAQVAGDSDVSVTKTDAPDPVTAGSNITYTITVTNNGPNDAENVALSDIVPTNTTFVSFVQASGTPCNSINVPPVGITGATVNCLIFTLPSGASATFTFVVKVNPGTNNGTVITNTANETTTTTDPVPGNNSATQTTTVAAALADLGVTKTDAPDPVTPGGNISYTITATNSGPSAATSVNLQDAMPFNTTFVSLTPPGGWTCTTPSVGSTGLAQCSIGSFPSGGTAVFTLVVHVSPAATNGSVITNNALINNQGTQDPNNTNDLATAQTLVQAADLVVTKTDSPDPVPPGTNLSYSITVTNNGGAVAQNVTLSDTVPANTTFVSLTAPAGWMCTAPPAGGTGTVSCTIGSLANGATAAFTIVVQVAPGTSNGTTITNTASASSTTGDPNPGNNSATATSTVGASADLAVSKSDARDPVPSDSDLTYTVTVSNNGPGPSQTPTLTDPVPAGTTFVSVTAPAGWSCIAPPVGGTGTVSCNAASLAAGATAVFTLVVHVTAPDESNLSNTATVASPDHDPNPNNNSDTEDTSVGLPQADVTVTKTDAPDPVIAGTDLNYTITVTNNGPSPAHNVTVNDEHPGGLTFASATPSQGTCAVVPFTVNCSLGTIPNGASVTIAVVAHVNAGVPAGVITNDASVSTSTLDPNTGNNSAEATTTVVTSADVAVTKTDAPDPVAPGADLTYTITVTNGGPSDATNASWSDQIPANTTFQSLGQTGNGSSFTCSTPPVGGTGAISCSLSSMVPGEVATFTVVVEVVAATPDGTVIGNTASATADTSDPATGNNSASTTTTVSTGPDIVMGKTDAPDPVTAGTNLTYTISATNSGSAPAAGVTVTDAVPGGTSFVSATPSVGTCTGTSTVTCSLGSIAPSATATVTLVVHVGASVPNGTVITNTASGATSTPESNTTNNSATATTTVTTAADLAVTKTDAPDPVTAGNNITYTITITNNGPSDAQNVVFTDTPPANTGNAGFSLNSGPPAACGLVLLGSPGAPSCSFATFPSGATANITLVVKVDPLAPGGAYTNTANATSSTTTDPNPANNAASATTTVIAASADLSVTKTDTPDPVTAGENVTYTITITNNGPDAAQNVSFTDTPPPGTTNAGFSLDSGPTGGCALVPVGSPGAPSCSFPTLAAGASIVATLIVNVNADTPPGTLTNTANASAATPDPNPANNAASATTTVVPPSADLSITKTDAPDPVEPGGDITYTITITNNGPAAAQNVTMNDSAPSGTTVRDFQSGPGPAASCTLGTDAVSCNYATFPAGASVVLTLVVTVDPSVAPGTVISNTATVGSEVSAATADPAPGNNSATATTTVASPEVPGGVPGEAPGTPAAPESPESAAPAAVAVIAVPRFTG